MEWRPLLFISHYTTYLIQNCTPANLYTDLTGWIGENQLPVITALIWVLQLHTPFSGCGLFRVKQWTDSAEHSDVTCGTKSHVNVHITPHHTTPHHITLHHTTSHYTTPHHTTPHHITPHHTGEHLIME